jgi:hypothetical protein
MVIAREAERLKREKALAPVLGSSCVMLRNPDIRPDHTALSCPDEEVWL